MPPDPLRSALAALALTLFALTLTGCTNLDDFQANDPSTTTPEPLCTPLERICNGDDTVLLCNLDGSNFQILTTCDLGAVCIDGACVASDTIADAGAEDDTGSSDVALQDVAHDSGDDEDTSIDDSGPAPDAATDAPEPDVAAPDANTDCPACPEHHVCIDGACVLPNCGNGQIDPGEQCDSGGTSLSAPCRVLRVLYSSGDASCTSECRWDFSACTFDGICGNGAVEGREQCDDGNLNNFDGCSAFCRSEGVNQTAQQVEEPPRLSTPNDIFAEDDVCNIASTRDTYQPGEDLHVALYVHVVRSLSGALPLWPKRRYSNPDEPYAPDEPITTANIQTLIADANTHLSTSSSGIQLVWDIEDQDIIEDVPLDEDAQGDQGKFFHLQSSDRSALYITNNQPGKLDVYLVQSMPSDRSGWVSYGAASSIGPKGERLDAFVQSVQDHSRNTFAHEFGHVVGLIHTFDTSYDGTECDAQNDLCCDTPEDVSSGSDTCREDEVCELECSNGLEPDASNIMSYWECAYTPGVGRFSSDQISRMLCYTRRKLSYALVDPPPELPGLIAPPDNQTYIVGESAQLTFRLVSGIPHTLSYRQLPPTNPPTNILLPIDASSYTLDTSNLPTGDYRWTVYYEDDRCTDGRCAAPVGYFAVLPDIDVDPQINVTPSSGPRNTTTFAQTGTGFTPNTDAECIATNANGDIPFGVAIDAQGRFNNPYTPSPDAFVGSYTLRCEDFWGELSNTVAFTIKPDTTNCTSRARQLCWDGDVYWVDSCGTREDSPANVCNAGQTCAQSGDTATCEGSCNTCATLGHSCGDWSDGCGGTLDCGSCGGNQTCDNGQCTCGAATCASQSATCGQISDGCNGTLDCGSCGSYGSCNGSNTCTCDPGFDGVACDRCAAGFSGYPNCQPNPQAPTITSVACTSYTQADQATCTFQGSNFSPTGNAFVGCMWGQTMTYISSQQVQVSGVWSCGCDPTPNQQTAYNNFPALGEASLERVVRTDLIPNTPFAAPQGSVCDTCTSGNGLYCGGPVGRNPNVLYNCNNGNYSSVQTCANGCGVNAPGVPDACN